VRSLRGANLVSNPVAIDASRKENVAPAIAGIYSYLTGLVAILNGGLSYGSGANQANTGNMDGQFHEITFPAVADTELAIRHNLNRLPVGYRLIRKDRACDVYDSSSGSWTGTIIYLKCNTSSAVVALELF
jgi:hypothetical protein